MRHVNDLLAFLLELVALAALGYWGFKAGPGVAAKVALAVGAPLLAAIVWGLFASPKATVSLPLVGVLVVKGLVFGSATLALYAVGNRATATCFAMIVVINIAIALLSKSVVDH
ncbi:YrdB family protein [Actinoplanes sp. NPDC020271]|uniref:YrdB family protein n=1 Tax=Actinoplanes sp. NPDC020271 TaxID=3363896 RepID=UPI00379BF32F